MGIVNTKLGRIEGSERRGLQVFKGIRYAQPPRDSLRWRAPVPVEPWEGVLSAQRAGHAAPQLPPGIWLVQRTISAAANVQSQDCLYLNVWTPACDAARRPVMVWIHGGAFVLGSGNTRLYDGTNLARNGDVVVVTINYRLGALGFLDAAHVLGGDTVSNAGIHDQIAALRWVRDHIADFGGDPENVTIFGESAGGMSVGTLLSTEAAGTLFHKAICQSGAAHNVSNPARSRAISEYFVEQLGGGGLANLEKAKAREVLAAQHRVALRFTTGEGAMAWQPSVDGRLLQRRAIDVVAEGSARGIPTLVGTNRHEFRLFMIGDRKGRSLDEATLDQRLARALPGTDAFGVALSRRAALAYASMPGRNLEHPSARWAAFHSDRIFHHPAHRLAAAQERFAPTWAYQFAWTPPGPMRILGACHGLEIPFVFGTLREPALRTIFSLATHARGLSTKMQRSWVEFARSGDPGHDTLPDWPTYGSQAATMRLSPHPRIEQDPFADGVRFWSEVESLRDQGKAA